MDPVSNSAVNSQTQSTQQSQNDAIDQFIDLATRKLDSSGVLQWVDKNEVTDVNNALIALSNSHGHDAADAALDKLADKGLLDTFVAEMYGAGAGGSVSVDGRNTIFSNVAKVADGETMAKFAQSVEASTNGIDGYNRMQEFASSVATHATPAEKKDFINALAPETTQGRAADYRSGSYRVSLEGDAEAAAVGTVLSSLDGSHAREALNSLSTNQLNAVVHSSIEQRTSIASGPHSSSVSGSIDASNFTDLAKVVAEHGTVAQKAQVFDTAGLRVDSLADASSFLAPVSGTKEAAATVTNGMTKILTSDTNAVTEKLAIDGESLDGRAMTNYVEQLVETGQTDTISSIQVQLMLGNDGSGNHKQRFNEVNSSGVALNAKKLGYFSGSVQNAVGNIAATNQEKQALAQDIIGTTSSILGGGVGVAFPVAGFAVGAGGEVVKRGIDQILSVSRDDIDEQIVRASLPIDPITNNEVTTSESFGQFQASISFVGDANERNGN